MGSASESFYSRSRLPPSLIILYHGGSQIFWNYQERYLPRSYSTISQSPKRNNEKSTRRFESQLILRENEMNGIDMEEYLNSGCKVDKILDESSWENSEASLNPWSYRNYTDADELFVKCHLIEYKYSYIPFNPFIKEEAKQRQLKSNRGDIYYRCDDLDVSTIHTLPDGSTLPYYRWQNRHWVFQKFDQGIKVDAAGLMDITPEHVAKHIARNMYSMTVGKRKNTKSTKQSEECSSPSEEEKDEDQSAYCFTRDENVERENVVNEVNNNNTFTVIEACCGYGGNTIQLAKCFDHVIAIDVNVDRIDMARHNAELYGVSKKIEWIHQDFNMWCRETYKGMNSIIQGSDASKTCDSISSAKEEMSQDCIQTLETGVNVPLDIKDVEKELARFVSSSKPTKNQHESTRSFLYPWVFLSPPWGGETYKREINFRMRQIEECDVYGMVLSASRIARNICIYLPPNQDLDEIVELAVRLPNCNSIIVENISIGLRKDTKYIVVKYLDEGTAKLRYPRLYSIVARLLADELEESNQMISSYMFLIEKLGIRKLLSCLEEAMKVFCKGGMKKLDKPEEHRSRGGIFFQVVKEKYSQEYKDLNKYRKTLTLQKKRKSNK